MHQVPFAAQAGAFASAFASAFSIACLVASVTPTAALADCTLRPTRPAETAFNARAMAALVAALPPAPSGVVATDARPFDFKNPPGIYEVLCEGSKEGEFSITARRQYIRRHSEAERKYWSARYDDITAQFHALKKLPPERLAEQQQLRQQSNAAWQAMRDAEKAGDKAGAQAGNARYRGLRDQADAMNAQHEAGVQAQTRELHQRRTAIDLENQRVDVVIGMNLQRLPRAAEGTVVGSHGAASTGKSAGLKVHNIAWSASGGDGPLRQALTAALERSRLQALLGQPLPSEAASEALALAAKAAPPEVPDLQSSVQAGVAANTASAGPASAGTGAAPPSAVAAAATAPPVALPAAPPVASQVAPVAPAAPATTQTTQAPPPAQPPPAPSALKKASEAVNGLRGLLGR